MNKRIMAVFVSLTVLLCLCGIRIPFIGANKNITAARLGGRVKLSYGNNRGSIFDCNGKPLVNEITENLAVIVPTDKAIISLSKYFSPNEIIKIKEELKNNKPCIVKTQKLINDSGIYGFTAKKRYGNNYCSHIIGYLDFENHGVSGIEKDFDNILYSEKDKTITVETSAKGDILAGAESVFSNSENSNSVTLTIDKEIQKAVNNAAKDDIKTGAVIVAECKTGKIKALVSFPEYDQNTPANYLKSNNSPLVNRALECYNVGSVFKICIATAALNKNIAPTFNCKGNLSVDGYSFNCHNKDGHGETDLLSAIKNSCNTYFYNLGIMLGGEAIYNSALSFSLGSKIYISNNIFAKSGNITALNKLKSNNRIIANYSIGQGDILLSPLSMLNVYNAVANGGSYVNPYIVEKTVFNGKETVIKEQKAVKVMSKENAQILKNALVETVTNGTGKSAMPENTTAAGKTATAETGIVKNGKRINNAWFCGFFPSDTPKYTCIIFAEDGVSGSATCAPVFKKIAENLANYK